MAGPRQVRLLGRTSPHSQSEPQGQGRAAPTPRPLKSSEQFAVFKSVFRLPPQRWGSAHPMTWERDVRGKRPALGREGRVTESHRKRKCGRKQPRNGFLPVPGLCGQRRVGFVGGVTG